MRRTWGILDVAVLLPALASAMAVLAAWWGRVGYPFDLEWMEGGMLVHAWRIQRGLPIYTVPDAGWIPFIYPPGYAAVVAAAGTLAGGISPVIARSVSVFGSLAAAAAVIYAGARLGRNPVAGLLGAWVFLVTYPDSGAFMDLIRPDGLATGLLAWALVMGLDRRPVIAGLLLALGFTVKHHVAAFGLPMLLGIMADRGRGDGMRFAAASALPALLFLGIMELRTEGRFSVWLLGVPAAHPLVMSRFYPGTMMEVGRDLPWILGGTALAALGGTLHLVREARVAVAVGALAGAALSVGAGENLEAIYRFFGEEAQLARIGAASDLPTRTMYAVQGAMLGAGGAAGVVFVRRRQIPGRWLYGMGVAAVAFLLGGVMRAHHGGYLNVYLPIHLVLGLATALSIPHVRRLLPGSLGIVLPLLPMVMQLDARLERRLDHLVPGEEDVAAGMRFVEALERCEPPVLAPIDPWLAVLAGHEPSWHMMALWDINHRSGPWVDRVEAVRKAAAERRWSCVVMPAKPLRFGFEEHYREAERPRFVERVPGRSGRGVFMPRTGWPARPTSIWKPRPSLP